MPRKTKPAPADTPTKIKIDHEEAVRFVELLSGDATVPECFHAIKKGIGAWHIHGSISGGWATSNGETVPVSTDVSLQLENWNINGREIYITAHALYDNVERNPCNEDIAEGRVLFIDSDGAPRPGAWHIEPTFLIEREDAPDTSWWAFWVIDGEFPPEEIEPYQRRLAAEYGTDPSVSDARRIVRLPGYVRHQHNEGPGKSNPAEGDTMYRLVEMPGAPHSTLADHDAKLPEVPDQQKREKGAPRHGRERCSEQYMADVLARISPNRKRQDGWLQVIAAFIDADVICEDGKPLPYDEIVERLREWSVGGATYDEAEFEMTCEWYATRTDDEDRTRVGLGTIDTYARATGYSGPGPTKSAQIVERANLFQAVEPSGSQAIIPPPDFNRTKTGVPLKTYMNAVVAVHHMAASGTKPEMDDFKGNVIFRSPVPWAKNGHGQTLDDDVILEIRLYLTVKYGLDLTKEMVLDAVRMVACSNRFHPVRDYLRGLEWDAVERADTWLIDYFDAEDTPYVRAVSRTWLLGAVARILTPGCKFDFMLILEGMQGLEKSTAFNLLAVKDEWFTDNLQGDLHNKDAVQNLQGAWIIEMPELDGMNRSEVGTLKAFLSRKIDKIRVPWDKLPKEFPRQCVLVGTSNESAYLRDHTGGRRFWPVSAGAIDTAGLRAIRDQLWAEAVFYVTVYGQRPELPREIWEAAAIEQEERRAIDPWEDKLRSHVAGLDRVHTTELLDRALRIPPAAQTANHSRRVKLIMTEQLGWKHGQVWQHNRNANGYSKPDEPRGAA